MIVVEADVAGRAHRLLSEAGFDVPALVLLETLQVVLQQVEDAGRPLFTERDPDKTGRACGDLAGRKLDAFCACGHIVAAHRKLDGQLGCDLCEQFVEVTVDVEPSRYEVWRDALAMAAAQRDRRAELDDVRLLAEAEWFAHQLANIPAVF